MSQPVPTDIVNQTSNSLPAVANAAGSASVTFQPPNGFQWAVMQIASQITGSANTGQLVVTKNGAFVCGSNIPALDSADGGFILLKPGDVLTLAWNGLSQGAKCQGTIYYSIQAIPQ